MTIADVLAVRVALDGVNSVVSGLKSIEQGLANAAGKAELFAAAGAAMTASGLGIAAGSIVAYEGLEKIRRSFVALSGEAEGNKLSQWLQDFATEANAPTEALQKSLEHWVSMGGEIIKARPLAEGLERFFSTGKTGEQLESLAVTLGQIRSARKLMGQERMQLTNSGLNLDAVAKELGIKDFRDALGMDADKVVDAIIRSLNKLPKQPPLLLQSIQNSIEGIQKALAPTGALFEKVFAPLVSVGGFLINAFGLINKYTFGVAGALVSISVTMGGIAALMPVLTTGFKVLQTLFSIQNIASFFAYFPRMVTALRAMLTIEYALAAIETLRAVIATAWAFAMANPGAVAAAAILTAAGIGVGIAAANNALPWQDKPSGGGGGGGAGNRPYRRSSIENQMADRIAAAVGA